MSTSRVQGSGNVDSGGVQYTSHSQENYDEDFCIFSEDDNKGEIKGTDQEIKSGTDKFGNSYNYLEGTNERLVNATKNTYMTQSEFQSYVKSVTGYDNLPNGVSTEFINGNLIFKKNDKKISLNEVKKLIQDEKAIQAEIEEKNKLLLTNFTDKMKEILKVDNIPTELIIQEKDGDFVFIDSTTQQILSLEELLAHEKIKQAQQEKIDKNRVLEITDLISEPDKMFITASNILKIPKADIKKYGIHTEKLPTGETVLACKWSTFSKCQIEWINQQQYLLQAAEDLGLTFVYSDVGRSVSMSNQAREEKGDIVAPGLESPHNYGVANDIVLYKDGVLIDSKSKIQELFAKKAIEYSNGQIEWGGNWKKDDEEHHFQLSGWRKKYKDPRYLVGL